MGFKILKDIEKKKIYRIIMTSIITVFVFIACALYYSSRWYIAVFGNVGFDAVLYTLSEGVAGTSNDLIKSFMISSLIPATAATVTGVIVLSFSYNRKIVFKINEKVSLRLYPLAKEVALLIAVVIFAIALKDASDMIGLTEYVEAGKTQTGLYETECKLPSDVKLTFPKEKRNLIYIYLESMENTFFSVAQGGALDANRVPELYKLAEDNINFSHNEGIGGARIHTGSTWTMGAMVSHTTGLPLKVPNGVGLNSYGNWPEFLPGVTSLSDILHENGYYQALMVGSKSTFGGRQKYYSQHHTDVIYDIFTAREDGIVPKDYYVWWGMEDHYLYQYAKQELLEISSKDEPFAFTMLTVDTHHVGGYKCKYCGNEYEEQYENVYACASKQLEAFINWIKEQSFYDNTTIIITGDHYTMDNKYIKRAVTDKTLVSEDYVRTIYNCFINSAVEPVNTKNRIFTTLDMFPTTLAAMGVKIQGERLGFGTNLFSKERTLAEKMGFDALEEEIKKASNFYNKYFLHVEEITSDEVETTEEATTAKKEQEKIQE